MIDLAPSAECHDVLLVEDHPAAARALTSVLQTAFEGCQVRCVDSCRAAERLLSTDLELRLALVDLALPDGTGLQIIRRLQETRPNTPCVVTTIYDDDEHIFPALAAGATGYLLKDQPEGALVRHLQALADGMPALSPRVARRLLAHFRQEPPSLIEARSPAAQVSVTPSDEHTAPALTRRETEVLALIAKGLQRGEVAGVLSVSENTVAKFIKDIYRKLNISSRAEAAIEAARRGLL